MSATNKQEVWLRGALPGIISTLQPVAHALLQAREELNDCIENFPVEKLWERPAGVASVAFHLQHLRGVLDRLFTYAKAKALDEKQLSALKLEGSTRPDVSLTVLVKAFNDEVDMALIQLGEANEEELSQPRGVGRAQLLSTVLGLYVHAAEHTMRHLGQMLVTIKILDNQV